VDLFLIRHAEAAKADAGGSDAARPLTRRGRRRFDKVVGGLERLDVRFGALLHSPLLRAVETAERLYPLLDGESCVTEHLAEAPGEALLAEIAELESERVALVGHEPWLSELGSWLASADASDRTVFELEKGGVLWLAGAPRPGAMIVRGLMPPAALARSGK
jgi:phosphohistidine phosphatase